MANDTSIVHGDTGFGTTTFEVREPEPFRRCSYCGSVHPEDLVRLRDGGQLVRVDRSVDWKYGWPHKVYVDVANPDASMLFYVGSTHPAADGPYAPGGEKYTPPGPDYVPAGDLTDEQIAILRRDGALVRDEDPRTSTTLYRFGTRGSLHAKFYNVHQAEPWLSDELRQALGAITGYVITDAGDGRIRWQVFDYGAAA